ncbi:MAG: hypothetical protein RJR37_10415 [Peptococcaceae bacterium MAG4]|nr:hypothetical protein [Peptococcaceae bacterium MAG4]
MNKGIRAGGYPGPTSLKMAEAEELEAIERERARRRQLSQLKRGHQEPVKETLPEREKGQNEG